VTKQSHIINYLDCFASLAMTMFIIRIQSFCVLLRNLGLFSFVMYFLVDKLVSVNYYVS
jgi:hypothetical protein